MSYNIEAYGGEQASRGVKRRVDRARSDIKAITAVLSPEVLVECNACFRLITLNQEATHACFLD